MKYVRYKIENLNFYTWISLCYILSFVITFPVCCFLGIFGFFGVDVFISDGSYVHGPMALVSGILSGVFLPLPLSLPFAILSCWGLKILRFFNVKITFKAHLCEDS